jgi:MYXO-CTERM domain-containing protein
MKQQAKLSLGLMVLGFGDAITGLAAATVTEPNRQVVPILHPTTPADYKETSIQDYFNANGETNIDAVVSARQEPGKFSPLCSFDATLVLSESNAACGIAWYNVNEADPTWVPSQYNVDYFPILDPSTSTSATFKAADIRNHPRYTGGYIGFALTRYEGSAATNPDGTPKLILPYFSEYQRNTLCTDCNPPGHWIAALAYRSTQRSDTYYVAFEDWPVYGNTASAWANDGDFNDKVFKLVGISCAGGGIECNTGEKGLCGKGISQCALDGGQPTCERIYTPRAEVCDAIDNDCNGEVDDGNLCPVNQICLRGSCVYPCGSLEFKCPDPLVCGGDGYCIEPSCRNVICDAGLACRKGVCTNPCTDIICPIGQNCIDGVCKDLCTGKVCGLDSVCQDGACVGTCTCVPCSGNKICDVASGKCIEPGCENATCDSGRVCVGGNCVDPCYGAKCPGGATCSNATCAAPQPTSVGGSNSGSGGLVIGPVGTGSASNGGGSAVTQSSSGGSSTPAFGSRDSGCACRMVQPNSGRVVGLIALLGLALGLRRRR